MLSSHEGAETDSKRSPKEGVGLDCAGVCRLWFWVVGVMMVAWLGLLAIGSL